MQENMRKNVQETTQDNIQKNIQENLQETAFLYRLLEVLRCVKEREPLVQCITNFVTVNDCANIILAAGASPSMSQDIREVEESVSRANALVCNMGAIDLIDSMCLAGKQANRLGAPVVLDPVAVGGTKLRKDSAKKLLEEVHFSVIRGNASEIRFLSGQQSSGSGVDVSAEDKINEDTLPFAVEMAKTLALKTNSVIAISGVLDIISDGTQTVVLRNGCATMARITGSGCMLTSLIGVYCAAVPENPFIATVTAMAAMGICGELAEEKRLRNGTGNATFRTDIIDAIFNLTEEQFREGICYEIF